MSHKLDTSKGFEKLDYMVKHGRKPGDGKGPVRFKSFKAKDHPHRDYRGSKMIKGEEWRT